MAKTSDSKVVGKKQAVAAKAVDLKKKARIEKPVDDVTDPSRYDTEDVIASPKPNKPAPTKKTEAAKEADEGSASDSSSESASVSSVASASEPVDNTAGFRRKKSSKGKGQLRKIRADGERCSETEAYVSATILIVAYFRRTLCRTYLYLPQYHTGKNFCAASYKRSRGIC